MARGGPRPALLLLLGLLTAGSAEEEVRSDAEEEDKPRACKALRDSNGRWEGSRAIGGEYTLRCAPGFQVTRHYGSRSATISCPKNLEWSEHLKCEDVDNCNTLKHGCGAKGICIDLVDGYDCNCEKGYPRRRGKDGEIVCGDVNDQDICGGATCGSYGLCLDLKGEFPDDDEEPEEGEKGEDEESRRPRHKKREFRCECADGFFDNGTTCIRENCGALHDELGTWKGSTLFNQEYTLECPATSFVWGYRGLRDITVRCSARGTWLSHPFCHSPAQEARDARYERFCFWGSLACVFLCICSAALAAGLTLGLATLEPFGLSVIMATAEEHCKDKEAVEKLRSNQANAKLILPLVRDHHRLLVTLMLFNTVANESLPIFLDELVPSWAAVLVSVTAVLICGEILPSAIFTGPSQMRIAGTCVPLVRLLQWLFYYISKPIIKLLDHLIGHEDEDDCVKYSRAELRALLQLHGQHKAEEEPPAVGPRLSVASMDSAPSEAAPPKPENSGSAFGCLLNVSEGTPVHEEHGEGPTILSTAELQLINGAFDLQDLPLDVVPYCKRRQCAMGGGEMPAAAFMVGGGVCTGHRAVLVLKSEAPPPAIAVRCPLVTAKEVLGCLRVQEVVKGGGEPLRDLVAPLALVPDWATTLEALRFLQGRDLGVVVHGTDGEATVQGVVSRAEILSMMLKQKRPVPESASAEGEDGPVVPTPTRRHVGHRPLFKTSPSTLERSSSGAQHAAVMRSHSRSATASTDGFGRVPSMNGSANRRFSA